jgi:hypothetical protein
MSRPKSRFGSFWPTSLPPKGAVFVVLKSYFDKSGGEEPKYRYLTLSGVAANDTAWDDIDGTWKYMLDTHKPKAPYMHMYQAVHLTKAFDPSKGWNDINTSGLVNWLLSYVTQFEQTFDSYSQFVCTIDMEAYRRLEAETYQMDSPVEICNSTCVEGVMKWYVNNYKSDLDFEASYHFDTGEAFEPAFKAKWERELKRDQEIEQYGIWSHIKSVGTVPMVEAPGIQIADMLAWGINRQKNPVQSTPIPKEYEHIALAMTRLAPSFEKFWDEEELRKRYRPLIYKPYEKY